MTAEELISAFLEGKNPKHAALVAKLKKQKGVRDPEALAAWIGRRMGSKRRKK